MIGLMALALGAAGASAATAATPDRAAIERIVHDYILSHPEILPEAMSRLQDRQVAQAVAANRRAIETPYQGAWEGSASPDVTLVEFFDYACAYCKASLPDVDRLLRDDPRLRVVYRDFPVLGEGSDAAARASLAAAEQGRYAAFHRAMYATGRPDATTIAAAAATTGVRLPAKPSKAQEDEIEANLALQRPLSLSGTPSWVVGDQVLSGQVGYAKLKEAIAAVRAAR